MSTLLYWYTFLYLCLRFMSILVLLLFIDTVVPLVYVLAIGMKGRRIYSGGLAHYPSTMHEVLLGSCMIDSF